MKSLPYLYLTAAVPAAALLGASVALRAQDNNQPQLQELRTQMEAMQKQLQATQAQLDKLAAAAPAASAGGAGLMTLGAASGLKVSGDLRVRVQQQRLNNDNPADGQEFSDQIIARERFRLGFDWANNEGWSVGAGLATGPATATTTNATYSTASPFSRGAVQLDYAYGKHTWALGDAKTSVAVGRLKNPYLNGGLLWDSDVRPVGAVVQEEVGPVFLTGGYHYVQETGVANQDDALLGAVQIGAKLKTAAVEGCLAVAYYGFNTETSTIQGVDYTFQLADVYADAKIKFGDGGANSVKLYADYTQNIGATGGPSQMKDVADIDPRHSDDAIVVGCEGTVSRFTAGASYLRVMADSLYAPLKDGDPGDNLGATLGGGVTDIEGWVYKAGVNLSKNMSINACFFDIQRLEGREVLNRNHNETYQLDFNYKF